MSNVIVYHYRIQKIYIITISLEIKWEFKLFYKVSKKKWWNTIAIRMKSKIMLESKLFSVSILQQFIINYLQYEEWILN